MTVYTLVMGPGTHTVSSDGATVEVDAWVKAGMGTDICGRWFLRASNADISISLRPVKTFLVRSGPLGWRRWARSNPILTISSKSVRTGCCSWWMAVYSLVTGPRMRQIGLNSDAVEKTEVRVKAGKLQEAKV
jgi:hypothetical protein